MIEQAVREAPSRREIRKVLGLDPDRPVLLYLLSDQSGSHWYFSLHARADSDYFHVQQKITSVLGRHPEFQVVIKGHVGSAYHPLETWIGQKGWTHLRSIVTPPFQDLLNLAEAVIIDAPSTTVLQALQTNCNLYIFDDWFRWEPGAKEALVRCSFFSDNLDTFCLRLDEDLNSQQAFRTRLSDDGYLNRYCYSDPKVSAGRLFSRAVDRFLSEQDPH